MARKLKNGTDARISKAFSKNCGGIKVPIMKIVEIFAVGKTSIAAGDDDEVLGSKLKAAAISASKAAGVWSEIED